MPHEYTVAQGDCIASIAYEHGLLPDTVWDHPANAELKKKRKDPNILMPGDVVVIPDIALKEVSKVTDNKHRFRRRGISSMLRIVVRAFGEPCTNEPYVLVVDGRTSKGVTDSEGRLEQPIAPNASEAVLLVGEGEERLEYEFDLGTIDPIDSVSGVQARLSNLGYHVGEIDGALSDTTREAITKFCDDYDIEVPQDEINETFRAKLREVHGF